MDTSDKHIPPAEVAKNAAKGLKLREKFQRGGTGTGWERARQLSGKQAVDTSIIKRMSSFFARHQVDKKAENFGNNANPSKGFIAWLLWGGDAGKKWADKIKSKLQRNNRFPLKK